MSSATDLRSDTQLVIAARAGDRSAFAAIHDRHAPRVHSVAWHLLGPYEATEATAVVWNTAATRLGQLREPDRLMCWLLALVRREVHRRHGRAATVTGSASVAPAAQEPTRAAALLRRAVEGSDLDRRLTLELILAGLEGLDLADALGCSPTDAAKQAVALRDEVEPVIVALGSSPGTRQGCHRMAEILADWDGRVTPRWRSTVARHVRSCEVCEPLRRSLPITTFALAADAPPEAPPAAEADRAMAAFTDAVGLAPPDDGSAWRLDGFPEDEPPRSGGERRLVVAVGTLLVVLLAALLFAVLRPPGTEEVRGVEDDRPPASVASTNPPRLASTVPLPTASTIPVTSTTAVATTVAPLPTFPTLPALSLPIPTTVAPAPVPTTTTIPPTIAMATAIQPPESTCGAIVVTATPSAPMLGMGVQVIRSVAGVADPAVVLPMAANGGTFSTTVPISLSGDYTLVAVGLHTGGATASQPPVVISRTCP